MRPRKPTNLKILEGTFRKDRAANEPKPVPIAPPKPTWVKGAAGEIWKQLAPDLDAVGCLTRVDGPAFALLAVHYSLAVMAYKIIEKDGITSIDEHGCARKHPMLQVLRDNSAAFKGYCNEFGLTPAARGKIDLPETPEIDEMEALLSKPRHL